MVDTGISPHPDVPRPAAGYDFVEDDADPTDPGDPSFDCTSHGTMVASVLAALTNNGRGMAGVTWGDVQLLVARVLDEQGNGSLLDEEEALRWAAERGARVANLSLGTQEAVACPDGLRAAVREVVSRGVLVVAAAGNNGPQAGTVVCPANLTEVVAVAATGPDGAVAWYSSRGPEVDLAAPRRQQLRLLRCGRAHRQPFRLQPGGLPVRRGYVLRGPSREQDRGPGAVPVAFPDARSGAREAAAGCGGHRGAWARSGQRLRPPAGGPGGAGSVRPGSRLPVVVKHVT